MDEENTWFGILIGFLAGLALLGIIVGAVSSNYNTCRDAAIEGLPLVWQKEAPFCKVQVEINGEESLLKVEDYREILEDRYRIK